jgi:hypothetical protein
MGPNVSYWHLMARAVILLLVLTAGALVALQACGDETGERGRLAAGALRAESTRPSGTLVYVDAENRLTAIDVATGRRRARRIRSLATCSAQLYVTGGRLVFAGVQGRRTVVFSIPLSLERRPTRLGTAHAFVPSTTEGRVWLAGTKCTRRRMVGAREVTVDGRVTASTGRWLPGGELAGAVRGGLVVQGVRGPFLWDPGTGRVGRDLGIGRVSAARRGVLAGCADAWRCEELVTLDLATGRTAAARSVGGYELSPYGGELSPDGSLLAVPAEDDPRWRIALVDSRTGRSAIIPGSRTGRYPETSWSAASGWLFIRTGRGRVLAYRPGTRRARVLPIRIPREAIAFIAG